MKKRKNRLKNILRIAFLCILCLVLSGFSVSAQTYEDVTDSLTNAHKESIYDIKLNAPFSKDTSGVREAVNPENGALTVTYDLFTLKGMGGDAQYPINLVYNNRCSSQKEESAKYNETTNSYDNITADKSKFLQSVEKLGTGWRFDMPYVEIPDDKNKTNTYVYMPDGRVFKQGDTESGLEDYKLSDAKFLKENVNGVKEEYVLKFVNGDEYRFNGKGYPECKSDKFGNIVNYIWSSDDIPVLTGISNNFGDTVSLSYTDKSVTVQYKDRKYVINRTSAENGFLINSVKDPQGRITEFGYEERNLKFDFFNTQECGQTSTNKYYLLNKIKYTGGLETNYEYITSKKWLYEENGGFAEYTKLSARYDLNSDVKADKVTYEYSGEPEGFPVY